MRVIDVIDDKNYDNNWKRFKREAVRGIIISNNKCALVKSTKKGFYKLPGGGIEKGESHIQTLIREVKEEAGLSVIPESIKEYGLLHEIRKSKKVDNQIFDQKSYYYFAEVEDELTFQKLDDYEIELGYSLEWVDLHHAYETNINLSKKFGGKFILREAIIFELLMNDLKS